MRSDMLVTQMKNITQILTSLHVVQPEARWGFLCRLQAAVIRKIDTRVGGLTRQELKGRPVVRQPGELLPADSPIVDSTGFLKRKME